MATKKAAKGKAAKKKKDMTDAEVFKKFGVGPEEKSLRKLISGQRRVNGRLYKSIELILDALPKGPSKGAFVLDFAKLAKADKINEVVPGDGPGCVSPGPRG